MDAKNILDILINDILNVVLNLYKDTRQFIGY